MNRPLTSAEQPQPPQRQRQPSQTAALTDSTLSSPSSNPIPNPTFRYA
ncbi:MAG: hypothetical protein ACP5E5_08145 [Acidobacteriaceae bacterium]